MKHILLFISLLFILLQTFSQGSGKALVFDGSNNNIQISNAFKNQNGTSSFSICAWVKSSNVAKAGQRILCDDENNTRGYALSLGDPGTGRLRFYVRGISPVSLDVTSSSFYLTNNKWHHVAAVYDHTTRTRNIYVNGELAATNVHGAGQWGSTEVDNGPVTIGGESDASSESSNRFQGDIDEVSYWEKALSATEIRSLMCSSLTGSETDLYAYWNFDGAALGLNNVPDITGNGYIGTLKNMISSEIITSSAPLGSASIYHYTSVWAGVTVNLTSTAKGNFEVNNITNSPRSIHVYRVDAVPNSTSGINGLGLNDTYYGLYVVGGTSSTYNVEFDYTNYPDANINETTLVLNTRLNNAITTWTDIGATLNTINNTLTKSNLSNTQSEFIISNPSIPLPVDLLFFDANVIEKTVHLSWVTATEINNDYFTIERSTDAQYWEEILTVNGAGNSNQLINYLEVDYQPYEGISYYRLKQTDFDGSYKYFDIVPVKMVNPDSVDIAVYPNPVEHLQTVTVEHSFNNNQEVLVVLRDIQGKEFYSKVHLSSSNNKLIGIPIDYQIPSGVYFVIATSENKIFSKKLIIN